MESTQGSQLFTGNIFIFQAFDVGDDIDLEKLRKSTAVIVRPLHLPNYFKGYHVPLPIDLPHPHTSSKFLSANIHSFGVISLAYQIPFESTFDELRKELPQLDADFQEQSVVDAGSIFKLVKSAVSHPKFFHLRTGYVVIQVDQQKNISTTELKEQFGGNIASLVRFEIDALGDVQKNQIINSGLTYYKGELYIIDKEAAFIYDNDYESLLDLFEFANIQNLELQYFDKLLDKQLNVAYHREVRRIPLTAYLPFIGSMPLGSLGLLKVEISVIIERLKSSIAVSGEEYIAELYSRLVDKRELNVWKESIDDKLGIIKDLNEVYQHRIDAIREDLLSVLIIILILIELLIGLFKA